MAKPKLLLNKKWKKEKVFYLYNLGNTPDKISKTLDMSLKEVIRILEQE